MTSPHEQALAACPLCGGNAKLEKREHDPLHVRCTECGLQLWGAGWHFRSYEEAIAAWNRRHASLPADVDGLVAEFETGRFATWLQALNWCARAAEALRSLSAKLVVVDASRNELAKDGGKRAKDALAALASPALAAETQAVPEGMAARDVLAERRRQIEGEGWTPEHDDAHANGELAGAAACYCLGSVSHWARSMAIQSLWPWAQEWWKPTDRRRDLVKAGALIFAEIDRLDRLAASPAVQGGDHDE